MTPELKAEALEVVKRYRIGPLYTPPSERGTIVMPEITHGRLWPRKALLIGLMAIASMVFDVRPFG